MVLSCLIKVSKLPKEYKTKEEGNKLSKQQNSVPNAHQIGCVHFSFCKSVERTIKKSFRALCVCALKRIGVHVCVCVCCCIFIVRTHTGQRIQVPVGGLVYLPWSFLTLVIKLGKGTFFKLERLN